MIGAPAVKADPIVVGIVEELADPENLARVRVRLPHMDGKTYWARIATLMAGPNRGSLFRPEPEDEVLVALVHGDPSQAYVIGSLWSSVDTPPENGGTEENHLRTLRSRSGHVLRFDDTPDAEKIEIIGKDEQQRVVVDVSGPQVLVEAAEGNVEVKAGSDVNIVARDGSVSVEAGIEISLKAPNITIQGDSSVTIKGGVVQIN